MSENQPGATRSSLPVVAATASLLSLVLWTLLALSRRQPFYTWYYHFAWYTTLVGLDAGLAMRRGRFPLLGRPRLALSLFGWSAPVWLVFEAVNLRVANWYYVFATPGLPLRRAGTLLAFATVFPAIFLAYHWWTETGVGRRWRGPRFLVTARLQRGLFATGCVFVGLSMWEPRLFFPLVWGALTLLLEPWNCERRPATSLLGDLSLGRYTRIGRLLLAGASVGALWEVLNSVAQTRWIYTVPGLERLKLFEMPALGYLGFPVFALDCFVIYQALVNLRVARAGWVGSATAGLVSATRSRAGFPEEDLAHAAPGILRGRVVTVAALAMLFAAAVAMGMDRWTVDSAYPRLEDLPGADSAAISALRGAGLDHVEEMAGRTSAALAEEARLDPAVASRLVETSRLVTLRGLGTENATALANAGITSRCELAAASAEEVSRAIRRYRAGPYAGRLPRVRVWLRAARRVCPAGMSLEEGE
jgi:predicted flap endonuclease-1-like 5' DNA nuclease